MERYEFHLGGRKVKCIFLSVLTHTENYKARVLLEGSKGARGQQCRLKQNQRINRELCCRSSKWSGCDFVSFLKLEIVVICFHFDSSIFFVLNFLRESQILLMLQDSSQKDSVPTGRKKKALELTGIQNFHCGGEWITVFSGVFFLKILCT